MDQNNRRSIKVLDQVRPMYTLLKDEKFFKIIIITCLIILYGALAIFFADRYYASKGTGGIFDAIYWAVVTITTVGYGDIVPSSKMGKLFALMIILSGPALLSLITASIASIFVERKIKEGKGLETIKDKGHIIICGWNENGEKVIDSILSQTTGASQAIVFINELDQEAVQSIQYRYKNYNIKFVRGNFVKEDVLARANLARSKSAIILADSSGGRTLEKADERTIFGTMAIKSIASKIRTCAELIHPQNKEHLLQANVDEVVVRGESVGPLLAAAAISPGVSSSLERLINNQDENKLWRIPVPSKYVGKTVGETARYLRDKSGGLLLAVIKEEEKIKLEDILSHDATFIDEFIKRKFEESGKDFFGGKTNLSVIINPSDSYEMADNDWLVVIAKEKPSETGFMGRWVGSHKE